VLALHRRIVEAGANPALHAGASGFAYWPGLVVFFAMVVVLPLMLVRTAHGDAFWGTALIALVIGAFLWQIGGFFWRNRPATYAAESIPAAVLPRG
jgi:hypothetical protein